MGGCVIHSSEGTQRRRDSSPSCDPLAAFLRCPDGLLEFTHPAEEERVAEPGYFQFGPGTICYGQSIVPTAPRFAGAVLPDLLERVEIQNGSLRLPFDPVAIVDNLRMERYPLDTDSKLTALLSHEAIRSVYYAVRPSLPNVFRSFLQRIYLKDFRNLEFPKWPIDSTVEQIHERLLLLAMKARNISTVPFIWFWPEGASASAIVTHDVETTPGINSVESVMELDRRFGIYGSYQIVPEKRYLVPNEILESIRVQHCEVNVQGLDHDGNLFKERNAFEQACRRINEYVHAYRAEGFRSPCMYRNPEWLDEIDVSYDMSIPNAAHLEPQRGGCCTVFPYFIGRLVELPLTMTQDYTAFHIFGDYSTDRWKSEIEHVRSLHGLMSFIIHPDYILDSKPRATCEELLGHLASLRKSSNVWIALPVEVSRWWRQRAAMKLVYADGQWQVTGEGRERARVAFAQVQDGKVAYTVASQQAGKLN